MGKYQEYYDKLCCGKKNYREEIGRIKKIFQENSNLELDKVLEIGCGTGNHTAELLSVVDRVVSNDVDLEMIEVAKRKLAGKNVEFFRDLAEIREGNFPLCVMMWHVINYFPDLKTMNKIFSEISKRLQKGGLFVFDMWNGVAAIRDLPGNSINEIEVDGEKILHTLEGKTDLMKQETNIKNIIRVYKNKQEVESFSKEVIHYIWTVKAVKDLLEMHGIDLIKIVKISDYETPANESDWKVLLIFKKRLGNMEIPLSEIIDRISILKLKIENSSDSVMKNKFKSELKEFESVLKDFKEKGFEIADSWGENLYKINKNQWNLESEMKKAMEKNDFGEMGRIYIEIQISNKKRIEIKNEIVNKTKIGFRDISVN